MIKMDNEHAKAVAIEFAKIMCSQQRENLTMDKFGAKDVADFIETLENRLTGQDETPGSSE